MQQFSVDQTMCAAMSAHEAGQLAEAESLYRQVLEHHADDARALQLLGVIAQQRGDRDGAVALMQRSIASDPNDRKAHSNLSLALREQGKHEQAVAAAHASIRLDPNWAISQNNLGVCLSSMGRFEEAAVAFRRALQLHPDWPECMINLGGVLNESGKFAEAIPLLRKAVEQNPKSASGWNNLGNALRDFGQLDDAIAAYEKAIELQGNYADAFNNLAMALNYAGRFEEALHACRRAVQLDPTLARGHMNCGIMLLRLGDFDGGWAEYDWRKKLPAMEQKTFTQPVWDGTNPAGKTILLHGEQGFGDVIQFVRYAPLLSGRGAKIIIQCEEELCRLLRCLPMVKVVANTDPPLAFDTWCSILDLPRIFQTRTHSIPGCIPYLKADPELSLAWRTHFRAFPRHLKVGLAWAGRPTHPEDHKRSIALSQLADLATLPGITFFSLQKGPAASQAATAPPGMKLVDCSENLQDFADTAAVIQQLDLVITVDTSVAHLAGAMGKPVWVLLPHVADWRWLRDRDDSPWYPTLRLFRQTSIGDWAGVVSRVTEALEELLADDKGARESATIPGLPEVPEMVLRI